MTVSVSRITIENFKGIIGPIELRLAGRSLTVLKGANASGKTSILDAIAFLIEGGGDPSVIHHGAKKAVVRMDLSDGKYFEKTQTPKGYKLIGMDENEQAIPAPQTFMEGLAKSFAFNPLEFLRADKKARADFAAKHANLSFGSKEISELKLGKLDIAGPLRELVDPRFPALDLTGFDALRKTVYERRKNANSATTELEKTVANLRKSLPAEVEAGVGMEDVLGNYRAKLAEVDAADKSELELIAGQVDEAGAEVQKAYESAISEAQRIYEEARSLAINSRHAALIDIGEGEAEAIANVHSARKAERDDLQRAIGEAEGNLKREGEIKALSAHLEQQRTRLAEKSDEAEKLTQALTALDDLKKSKLDTLPIAGLEIRDGEVFRDGIPFDQLNQARQYVTSIEIGCLGLGDLPLIVADEFEHLDSQQQKVFFEALEGTGLQMIVAEVSDGPLRAEPQGSLIA